MPPWFLEEHPEVKDDMIGYFSLEFGLHESLPLYSGGLGILAGDHCKAASDIGLPFLIDYLNTWERNIGQLDNAMITRYEDLRSDTAETLKKITVLMGESFNDEEIAEAVSFGSFDNLRKLETSGFFRRGGMRLHPGHDDPYAGQRKFIETPNGKKQPSERHKGGGRHRPGAADG